MNYTLKRVDIEKLPLNRGLKSSTNRTLIGTGVALSIVWVFGETLGIPTDILQYLDKAITGLGLITGVAFRNKTTTKIDDFLGKAN